MTEILARISARRPWATIGIWVALVVVGLLLSSAFLDSATTTDFRLAERYESERAATLLEDKLRGPENLAEIVIVQSSSLTADLNAFRAKVEAVHGEIVALGACAVGRFAVVRLSQFSDKFVWANTESEDCAGRRHKGPWARLKRPSCGSISGQYPHRQAA